MSRGTKLFQQAGSPLIQGHSKRARSASGEFVRGALAALAIGVTGLYAIEAWQGELNSLVLSAPAVFQVALLHYGPGALVGALAGVFLGRRLGSTRPWKVGMLAGVLFGIVGAALVGAAV